MTKDQELEALYGPAARYSDHKRGDHITYREDGIAHTGTIEWVCAAGEVAGKHVSQHYIVISGELTNFPTFVWPGQIIVGAAGEPTLVRCPYCRGQHYTGEIERCPLRPNR